MDDHEPPGPVERIAGILASVIGRMGTLARTDPQLRELFAQLGHSLLSLTAEPPAETGKADEQQPVASSARVEPEPDRDPGAGEAGREPATPSQVSPPEPLPPITLGMSLTPQPPAPPLAIHSAEPDASDGLPEIVKRCRLKAEACRWASSRIRSLQVPSEAAAESETPDELIARAKALPCCYLWMCQRSMQEVEDAAQFDHAAACFENCADAAALLNDIMQAADTSASHEAFLERALDAAAEAQSMLRVCVASLADRPDLDQQRLFELLRGVGHRRRVFIRRYMRLEDPADLSQAPVLRERIQFLREESTQHDKRDKQRRKAFNKLGYDLKRVKDAGERASSRDWQSVVTAIELVLGEVPPSNVELREMLLPFAEAMPEFVAENDGVQRVLFEIDRYIASRPQAEEWTSRERPTDAVLQVANLLAGRSILLVGGELRPRAKEALEKAFRLRELVWMKTREHNTRIDFDPDVSRPDVAVVVLAIRWSRHSFGEVEAVCRKHDKPLVRLPAGYHPNQVAEQIMAQCSERLTRLATLKSSA